MNARSKIRKMTRWYEEMIFLTEVIALIYQYMACRRHDIIDDAFGRLGEYYKLKFIPDVGSKVKK